jgi:hypothetical protein
MKLIRCRKWKSKASFLSVSVREVGGLDAEACAVVSCDTKSSKILKASVRLRDSVPCLGNQVV